ncbi:MAG TPA: hypothetical protein H9851_06720 [Candidatus Borkfalkia faecavium]|uniref:Uncharacterized protein n=1 Tax=Candidatus Borkfalkia faecavium TaxID=2838508 RepID=A0A9D2AV14_9FIRM|nr:hypothetical protein [Candidatus Borkfalkia faecavium]
MILLYEIGAPYGAPFFIDVWAQEEEGGGASRMRRAGGAKGSEKRASTDARFCISEHRKICSLQISQGAALDLTILQ